MTARPSAWWLAPVAVLVLLSYVLPYTVLRDLDTWYGSALLWTVATVVVIGINVVASSPWRDGEHED